MNVNLAAHPAGLYIGEPYPAAALTRAKVHFYFTYRCHVGLFAISSIDASPRGRSLTLRWCKPLLREIVAHSFPNAGLSLEIISNGLLINMKAHQQRHHLLRQVTGDAKMALQFPTEVRSNDLTVYRPIQIIRIGWIEFAVSGVKPFLPHAKKNGTEIWVGALPRCNKALGRELSTVTSLIVLHKQCPVFKTKPAFAPNRSVDL